LYARGDKTRVYFFTKEELLDMFSPLPDREHRFETLRIGVDRRLIMNRKRKLKMFRVWMQGEFRKPAEQERASRTVELDASTVSEDSSAATAAV